MRPRFSLLILLATISVLPLNMFVPALPRIADDFGVEYAVVNIAIGGYAIVLAITQIIGGALSDRLGRRPVALAAVALFAIASLGCLLAPNIEIFLAFRMMQGVVAACQATALAAIRDSWEGAEMRNRVGTISSAYAFGPMLGPTVGGVLATHFGWRSNFVLFVILGGIALVLTYLFFDETNTRRATTIFRVEEYTLIVRSRIFWAYSLLMAFSIGVLYTFLGGAPKVAEEFGGLSDAYVGIMLGLLPLGFIIGSQITARTAHRVASHRIILIGRSVTLLGILAGIGLWSVGVDAPLSFFLPCMSIGLGNGLSLPSANAGVMSIAKDSAGAALGLASAIMASGASLLSFFAGFFIVTGSARESVLLLLATFAAIALMMAAAVYRQESSAATAPV